MPKEFVAILTGGVKQLGLTLNKEQIDKLMQYILLIQKWNKTYNLTAVNQSEDIINKHILDSLTAANYIYGEQIIDVGSGAGLPGVPLAIVLNSKQFFLLDANSKKTRFLQQVVISLGLNNVQVVQERIEQFESPGALDTVICRALASQSKVLDLTQHLFNHGQIILMLGKQPSLHALPRGYTVKYMDQVVVPNLNANRHITVIDKHIDHG